MTRTRPALAAGLAALALALSGCGLLGGQEDPAPAPDAPAPQEPDASDGGGEPQADDAPEPSDGGGEDDAADDATAQDGDEGGTNSAAMTSTAEPGTRAVVGEALPVHVQALQEGEEHFGYAVVATTVTDVEEADPSLLDRFDEEQRAELEGKTGWYIRSSHEIISIQGEPNATMIPSLWARDAAGRDLGGAVSFGGGLADVCGVEGYPEKVSGATATTCDLVFTDGDAPAEVVWEGDDNADGAGPENPYREHPVVWANEA
jgi:hypothetical protein